MNANGSRDTANRYFIDGIEFMDYDAMTYSFSPSVDSLAEFKVETSSYAADAGGAPGGQVNCLPGVAAMCITARSGSLTAMTH